MIRHTVCFTLVHEAGSAEEVAFLTEGAADLAAIPGVHDFEVARQVGKGPHLFQFAMSFDGRAEYDAYNVHPVHQEFVATRWATEVADFTEFDFVPYERIS